MIRDLIHIVGLSLLVVALAFAIGPKTHVEAEGPALTEVQRLSLVNKAQEVQIWDMNRAKAQHELDDMIAAATPAGYKLVDKGGGVLVLEPVPPKEPAK